MKRENGKPAKQRIKNWLLQRKNRLRIADTFVIGSIMTLFSAAAVQSPQGADVSDYKTKFPLDTASLAVDAAFNGEAVVLSNVPENFREVKYKVDTVIVDTAYLKRNFRTLGGYVSETKTIALKYFVVDSAGMDRQTYQKEKRTAAVYNSKSRIKSCAIHEGTHEMNDAKGIKDFGISLLQFAKICVHDEISAQISELLEMRQKYLQTKDFRSFGNRYGFYVQALKDGRIKPNISKVPAKEELSLIVNGMSDWWQKTFQDYYEKAHRRMAEKWFHKSFPYRIREKALTLDAAKKHNAEYMRRLKKCYSFDLTLVEPDGSEKTATINFARFLEKDADISEDFKKTLHAYAKTTFKDGYTLYKKACKSEEYVQAAAASKIQGEDTVIITQRNAAQTQDNRRFLSRSR